MKKWQKVKEERGITLVALIITIIVLVILAAVSINAAFSTGIIDTAVNGAVNYAEAQKQEQVTFDELDGSLQDILNRINEYDIGGGNRPTIEDPTPNLEAPKQDGSWDNVRKVNTPKIAGTGLTPVYYNGSSWVELTSSSTKAEWNSWFNYDTQNWANARTADGSMWVWIPSYEYKIDSTAKTIDVRFTEFTNASTKPTETSGYTLHPAFLDGTANTFSNGEWDKYIPGFWVAKYAAGWQNGTQGEGAKAVDYSSLTYTTTNHSSNYLEGTLSVGKPISYPVFKANTYAYNCISAGDIFLLAKEIAGASRYGLSNVDSHMLKNSEWGAVAYLTHSKYGLNGVEVTQNIQNLNNTVDVYDTPGTKAYIYGVTSYGKTGSANDTLASSTHNMSGVFDLSGCVYERTAGFYKGGKASTEAWHSAMATNTTAVSTKYVTLYTADEKKPGDAIMETKGWNSDCAAFVTSISPVFGRGYTYAESTNAGVFASDLSTGFPDNYYGFRAVLVP